MQTDQHPIPHEALPPGWGPATVDGDQLVYRRHEPSLELLARKTTPDQANPSLGIGRCWVLEYRHYIGELPVSESIGHVSTRQAAVRGLLECMHTVHEHVDDSPADPIGVQAAFEDVSLERSVPDVSTP